MITEENNQELNHHYSPDSSCGVNEDPQYAERHMDRVSIQQKDQPQPRTPSRSPRSPRAHRNENHIDQEHFNAGAAEFIPHNSPSAKLTNHMRRSSSFNQQRHYTEGDPLNHESGTRHGRGPSSLTPTFHEDQSSTMYQQPIQEPRAPQNFYGESSEVTPQYTISLEQQHFLHLIRTMIQQQIPQFLSMHQQPQQTMIQPQM